VRTWDIGSSGETHEAQASQKAATRLLSETRPGPSFRTLTSSATEPRARKRGRSHITTDKCLTISQLRFDHSVSVSGGGHQPVAKTVSYTPPFLSFRFNDLQGFSEIRGQCGLNLVRISADIASPITLRFLIFYRELFGATLARSSSVSAICDSAKGSRWAWCSYARCRLNESARGLRPL
jgi:hypothetical protein